MNEISQKCQTREFFVLQRILQRQFSCAVPIMKEGAKEGRKERRREGRKEGSWRKEVRKKGG
jgi:hypothetical protein